MRLLTVVQSSLWLAAIMYVPAGIALENDGGQAAYASCIACHGSGGEGNAALNAPMLAGLDAAYLQRQLTNYRTGLRGSAAGDVLGAQMRAMAMTLASAQAVAEVAAYIAALQPPGPPPPVGGPPSAAVLRNGENQYNGACGACHGGSAQGNVLLHAPRLAGQQRAYLKRQYENFADGVRGSHPDDRYGRQMQMMATVLASDQDLEDVLTFIQLRAVEPR